jgi:hypothetical protein
VLKLTAFTVKATQSQVVSFSSRLLNTTGSLGNLRVLPPERNMLALRSHRRALQVSLEEADLSADELVASTSCKREWEN